MAETTDGSDPLEQYNWEEDEGWQVIWRKIDMTSLDNKPKDQREKWVRKKKTKYFKQHVDPEYTPPKVEPKPAQKQAPRQKTPPTQEQEKPKPTPSATGGASSTSTSSSSTQKTWSYSWYFYLICHCVIVTCCPLIVLKPTLAYKGLLITNAMLYGYFLNEKNGKPQLNAAYAEKFLQDENTFHLFYSFVLWMMRPSVMWVIPTVLRSLVLGTGQLRAYLYYRARGVYDKVKGYLKMVEQRKDPLRKLANSTEVWIGIWSIPGCFFLRVYSMSQVMVIWQFLRMKYMTCPSCKIAFSEVNRGIRAKLPGAVLGYWDKITGYLHGMGDMSSQSRSASRCSVM